MGMALFLIPTSHSTCMYLEDGEYGFLGMTIARKALCYFMIVVQVVVVVLLMMAGTLFLAFTINPGDLLLNAAALQIVLGLDELFYQAFAPNHARKVLQALKPLKRPAVFSYHGLNPRPVVLLIAILAGTAGVVTYVLEPQSSTMRETRDALCEGNLAFVVKVDRSGVLFSGGWNTSSQGEVQNSYQYQAVRQLIDKGALMTDAYAGQILPEGDNKSLVSMSGGANGMEGGLWSIDAISGMQIGETSGWWNNLCVDMITDADGQQPYIYSRFFQQILEEDIGKVPINDCSEIVSYCEWDSQQGVSARTVCPITCGCNIPNSTQPQIANGCPPTCMTRAPYTIFAADRECEDVPNDSPYWDTYKQGLQGLMASYPKSWHVDLQRVIDATQADGCGAIGTAIIGGWTNLCLESEGWFLKGLTFPCPITCKCHNLQDFVGCPTSCEASLLDASHDHLSHR
jgi:hypothetical protein